MTALEQKLRALVAGLDDTALEILASKGLLRRAQKDLERGVPISIEGEDATTLRLKVDQFIATIPEAGPAKAKCSCPAVGICQHILTAALFLKRPLPLESAVAETVLSPPVGQELLALTRDQIEAWCGKANFRAALELASQPDIEIEAERGLVVRFPGANAQCHYAPGAGLDGIIVSGNAKDERRIAAAAIIAFQRSQGITWDIPVVATAPLEESAGAPRSRREVLAVAGQLFTEMLDNGLSRVSSASHQRLATLAVSAIGVNLPRLSLALRGLSDDCALFIARDARSDLGRLLVRMAHTHALCAALQQGGSDPRPDLVGWHRTHYDAIGHLDLVGVSAWPWRTASGYSGLTVLFWDTIGKRWHSWTDSRPAAQQRDFHPVARYTQPGPWERADSPRQLSRSSFRLINARRNSANRLSGSGKSRVMVGGPAKLAESGLALVEDWTALLKPLESQIAVGLTEPNPLDSLFALKPAVWGPRGYDPVAQVFSWHLSDSQHRPLSLEIGYDGFSEPGIQYLEKISADSVQGAIVIGRLQLTPRGLSLHPFTIHGKTGDVTHLCLDTAQSISAQKSASKSDEDDEFEDQAPDEPAMAFSPAINGMLDEIDDALLLVAEAGIAGLNPLRIQGMVELTPRTARLGLQALATGIENMIVRPAATGVLRCSYLAQLHRRAMPLST